MEEKITLEKFEDKFPYNWLNSLFDFPIVASTSCKMWWAQDRGIIGDATFEAENAGPYGLHYIFDLNKSYDQEGFLYWDATIDKKSAEIKSGSLIAETIENINVPENTDFVVIGIIGESQLPSSSLKNPEGKIYEETNTTDNILYSDYSDANEGFWTIKDPKEGNWEITLQNPGENDSIFIFVQKEMPGLELSFTQNGNNVSVNWNHELFNEDAEIVLQIDNDSTGFDGFTVAHGNANSGQINFTINDSLNECNYYLSAMVLDGIKLSSTYAKGFISNEKLFLDPPVIDDVFYYSNTGMITVNFQNSNDVNTLGYFVDVIDGAGIDSTCKIHIIGDNTFEFFIEDIDSKEITMTSFDCNGLKGCPSEPHGIEIRTGFENRYNEKQTGNNLAFYPNPTTGRGIIKYKVENETFCSVKIADSYGRIIAHPVKEEKTNGVYFVNWDFGNLPNGLYLIILQTEHKNSTFKCILNR